jgi:hypothetical protein
MPCCGGRKGGAKLVTAPRVAATPRTGAPAQPFVPVTTARLSTQKHCPKCAKTLFRKLRYDQKVGRYISWFQCDCGYEGVV